MKKIKKFISPIFILAGPLFFILLVMSAVQQISHGSEGDIGNPVPWIIIIAIAAPIAAGLSIFGWYCWKGEYDDI